MLTKEAYVAKMQEILDRQDTKKKTNSADPELDHLLADDLLLLIVRDCPGLSTG